MNNTDDGQQLKSKLEDTCLKFVVVNENENKKIKLIGGKNYVRRKLKLQQIIYQLERGFYVWNNGV